LHFPLWFEAWRHCSWGEGTRHHGRLVDWSLYMEPWSECNCSSRAAGVDAAPHLRGFVVQDCARHWLSWPIPRGSKARFRTTAGSSQGSATTSHARRCSLSPSLASPPVWRAPGTTLARQDPPEACPNQSEPVAARGLCLGHWHAAPQFLAPRPVSVPLTRAPPRPVVQETTTRAIAIAIAISISISLFLLTNNSASQSSASPSPSRSFPFGCLFARATCCCWSAPQFVAQEISLYPFGRV
jgi:hypothetical protein